jgi:glycogen debranching enzyme
MNIPARANEAVVLGLGTADAPPELPADAVSILQGSTFLISDFMGEVKEGSVGGFFQDDTRHLSRFRLTVDGRPLHRLSSDQADYTSAAFFLTVPDLHSTPAQTISVHRNRFVGDGFHEDITLQSHRNETVRVTVRLSFDADFADLFEVKELVGHRDGGAVERRPDAEASTLRFDHRHDDFRTGTVVQFSERPRFDRTDAEFDVHLEPRGSWRLCLHVRPWGETDGPHMLDGPEGAAHGHAGSPTGLEQWRARFPRLRCRWEVLEEVYERSILDLASLRLHMEVAGEEVALPAAGLPWFMTIFGRDTIITSYQSLLVRPGLARGALRALAGLQGDEVNDFRDEQPGKILHEIRFGELTALGKRPHSPYYGSIDATPLWLILLSEHWRITGETDLCRDLRTNALGALEWLDRYGDRDGDGYVEYATRSQEGLRHQGWKDSWNGVLHGDGRAAEPPIALSEVQGYVFDAKRRMADVAEAVWLDPSLAQRLRAEAKELSDRFNRDFWIDRRGGYYALALDRDKRPVDSMASNMGHLLWCGIVPEDRAESVVARLFSPAMFSGWGIRTLSEEDMGYNPTSYHNGTVWPHDNSLISDGLVRYGFRDEANRVALGLLEAATHTGYRLPEVFAGYPRDSTVFPVRYTTASSPQAWATAALFLWLRQMLGLHVRDGALVCEPAIPEHVGRLALGGVYALGRRWNIEARGSSARVEASSRRP